MKQKPKIQRIIEHLKTGSPLTNDALFRAFRIVDCYGTWKILRKKGYVIDLQMMQTNKGSYGIYRLNMKKTSKKLLK